MTFSTFFMPVEELMKEYTPGWGEDWDDSLAICFASDYDTEIVTELDLQMRANDNTFKRPIWLDAEEKLVMNGMHRIITAYMGGVKNIMVCTQPEPDEVLNPIADIHFTLERLDGTMASEEERDMLAEMFRSFDSPEGWVNCDHYGETVHEGKLDCWGLWETPGTFAQIEEILKKMVSSKGFIMNISKISSWNPEE